MTLKPIVWTLDEGVALVRELQPMTREYNYHLVIGGGVVNAGSSTKDLDLYFLPMSDHPDKKPNATGLINELLLRFGPCECIGYGPDDKVIPLKFANNGKRIDAFIWK